MENKKEARLRNKTKKLNALVNILELNDKDRQNKAPIRNASAEPYENEEPSEKKQKTTTINGDTNHGDSISNGLKEATNDIQSNYTEVKHKLKERTRQLIRIPKFKSNSMGDIASLSIPSHQRIPLFLHDIENLIVSPLLLLSGNTNPLRWCKIESRQKLSHITVLVVEGLSLLHFENFPKKFEKTCSILQHQFEVIMPSHNDGRIVKELLTTSVATAMPTTTTTTTNTGEDPLKQDDKTTVLSKNTKTSMVNSIFSIPDASKNNISDSIRNSDDDGLSSGSQRKVPDKFSRTQLLLSALQMVEEGYPIPLRGELANRYKDFVFTKDNYGAVTPTSPMFGLDCEMCRTSVGINELTRIAIVNENCESIYETLVRPEHRIIDYLTSYSGITEEMLRGVTKTLSEVQADVRKLLPSDAILVGHSLNCDLMAMRMMHPYIIDTSVILFTGVYGNKNKLRDLAIRFLDETIQNNPLGHDPHEDCTTCIKLTKLKLSKSIDFGHSFIGAEYRTNNTITAGDSKMSSNSTATTRDCNTAIIASQETGVDYKQFIAKERGKHVDDQGDSRSGAKIISNYSVDSNKLAIMKTKEICMNQALTLTHIKIPEHSFEQNNEMMDKQLSKIDRWTYDLWNSIAIYGMLIVVFGGVTGVQSGVAMLNIKK